MKWEIERYGSNMTAIDILLLINIFRDKEFHPF